MNMQSGANIVIRRKGSVTEGRGRGRAKASGRREINDRNLLQLRDLAVVNGTLRDD
ncbi:hypothetical protein F5B22DRAFT_603383 [Xylaria bambusicola]|uniref:uncharacterized protein n=1 Tax=Xylaria bambusicola TaxID=326684 RepID=UPI0020080892|nr:uncharacterized protein F5B22DRAFT_603383 [Xylaria bambusicola]KAI0517559.1 hypothetical protein F5B22DRAFT_603383 [Xylaria bambusicola]